jgi:HTH-type transcriptional regulator / antitoxin HipB
MDKDKIRNVKNFDELLDIKYGKIGSENRDKFEEKAQYFVISEILKEARKEANMTQEELATKWALKKAISLDLKTENVIFSFQHFTEFLNLD